VAALALGLGAGASYLAARADRASAGALDEQAKARVAGPPGQGATAAVAPSGSPPAAVRITGVACDALVLFHIPEEQKRRLLEESRIPAGTTVVWDEGGHGDRLSGAFARAITVKLE